ncbi:stage III sporulation protein AA [Thermoanaerobacterium thermosaccharolyticum]|uniref:Stage III sporulation protein AA n=1 Tax=Thermoanaerobacterium thermosaccharolyticum TaxID=1517 RepID=A0A231VHL1_THETR|nr:stage III sporulation protein AA [Thermoanaerobacterium thermosaccharolyticum]OXT07649.1 stage III sporulation protein AA [Thermoanaerobacterium thermosaccharolyticum]
MINKSKNYDELLYSLPLTVRNIIIKLDDKLKESLEEIRLRIDKPLMIHVNNQEKFLSIDGKIVNSLKLAYIVTSEDCEKALQLISKSSIYAFENEIKNGYITLKGGYRVGICGKCVLENGSIKTIVNVSGFNYRIMRQCIGVSDEIMKYIIKYPNIVYNTLIISPPQCGKTTLLRDIARNISNGMADLDFNGENVSIIDERSEIAACFKGNPQNDVGYRTDVLDSCPKHIGILMMIRSMSPKVIITDEIGKIEDILAIHEALNAGVSIITTVHGKDIEDIMRKKHIDDMLNNREFDRYVILSRKLGAGTIDAILDKEFKAIFKGPYRKECSLL